jgi:hypothetical protein
VLLVYKVIPEVLLAQLVQTENKVLLAIPEAQQVLQDRLGQPEQLVHLVDLLELQVLLEQLGSKVIPVAQLEQQAHKEQLVYSQAAQAALIMLSSVLMELEAQRFRTPLLLLTMLLFHSRELQETQQQI